MRARDRDALRTGARRAFIVLRAAVFRFAGLRAIDLRAGLRAVFFATFRFAGLRAVLLRAGLRAVDLRTVFRA
ncbi:MAG: hypothetical protein MJE12_14515, partial [Alphaproteobacteria bacterium]|nr:hypothetical protein [Alphaproteobacteria bacterium]